MDAAKAYGKANGREFINPCLGDELLAGQGTVALEVVEELPNLRALVVNVGGGGLLGGCGSFLRERYPDVQIYGAQSVNTAAMSQSLAADRVVPIPSLPTLADGLAGLIDEDALDIGRNALDEIVTLTEEEIADAIAWFAREHQMRVEGAGACSAGAVLFQKIDPQTPCVVVVSGGNIDEARWNEIVDGRSA
jgi:threonine dehydratase